MEKIDYLTEKEASAIRGMVFGGWKINHCNICVKFEDGMSIPLDLVKRYYEDWRKSGR